MDPNAALKGIREQIASYYSDQSADQYRFDLPMLLEHIEALDGWLTAGGFKPAAWQR